MCPMGYKGYFFCVPSFVTPSEAHPRTKASGRALVPKVCALCVCRHGLVDRYMGVHALMYAD